MSTETAKHAKRPVTEADARLIAAAPELLAACKRAVAAADDPDFIEGNLAYEALKAAIARAEGRGGAQ